MIRWLTEYEVQTLLGVIAHGKTAYCQSVIGANHRCTSSRVTVVVTYIFCWDQAIHRFKARPGLKFDA